jgi:Family of unknown function (DUF6978)
MSTFLSDQDIERLLKERKPLPTDYRSKIQVRPKRGHKERHLDVRGAEGNDFRLVLRQSRFNPLDFSIILIHRPANTSTLFRLRRYNGKSHEHSNVIEAERFYDFHIHQATERYRQLGAWEDAYAEVSERFSDFHGALSCMLKNCGFELPPGAQRNLFEGI